MCGFEADTMLPLSMNCINVGDLLSTFVQHRPSRCQFQILPASAEFHVHG